MVRVTIPDSVEAGIALAEDANSKNWMMAAWVVSMTKNSGRGRPSNNDENSSLSASGFVKLGIPWCKSRDKVRAYRAAWEAAGGDMNIKPGDAVDIPDADWSDYYGRNAIHGPHAKRAEEAAAYRQFPSATQETTEEPHWEPNPDGSADRHVTEGVTIHKPSAAEMQAKRESPAMAGAYQRSDITNVAAMIDSAASYLRRALDKADDAGIEIPNLDVIEDYLMTARNHNSKITNTPEQSRPGLRVV